MQSLLTLTDLNKAITGELRGRRARVVTAEILFDEDGNMLTYTVASHALHIKQGGDIVSLLGRVVNAAANKNGNGNGKKETIQS